MNNKRFRWALLALVIGIISLVVYFQTRVPPGLEPLGDNTVTIAYISLAVAVVGLLTAVVNLIKAIVEARQ